MIATERTSVWHLTRYLLAHCLRRLKSSTFSHPFIQCRKRQMSSTISHELCAISSVGAETPFDRCAVPTLRPKKMAELSHAQHGQDSETVEPAKGVKSQMENDASQGQQELNQDLKYVYCLPKSNPPKAHVAASRKLRSERRLRRAVKSIPGRKISRRNYTRMRLNWFGSLRLHKSKGRSYCVR